MNDDRVLLLGADGFVGQALAHRFAAAGIPHEKIGRENPDQLAARLTQCRTVIHLASSTTPGSSAGKPQLEAENIALTAGLTDMLARLPQTHLIYFSSGGALYGNPATLPVTEESAIQPISEHGSSKAAQEALCCALRLRGQAVTILRPSNIYGPGQSLKRGFGLIRTLLECVRTGAPVEVWGDGENIRDFIFIDDVTEACLLLVRRPDNRGTYNLGSANGFSINQVLKLIEAITGKDIRVLTRPSRGVDVRAVVLDPSRIRRDLGWAAQTSLAEGIQKTWDWVRQQP